MTPDEILAVKDLAYKLIALVTGESTPLAFPPGTVPVRPTGVAAAGVVRYWPAPRPQEGETAWGYVRRMSTTKDGQGLYWFPPQAIGSYGLMAASLPESMPWPEQLDRLAHAHDWMTAEELELERQRVAQWGEWNARAGGQ